MAYGACAIDGRYRRMDGRAFGFSGVGKGLTGNSGADELAYRRGYTHKAYVSS